jgi:transposase-like protein
MYLFRAVDNRGQIVDFYLSETRDREAATLLLRAALANPDNRTTRVYGRWQPELSGDCPGTEGKGRRISHKCRHRSRRYGNNRIESDHRHVKRRLRAMQGPGTAVTA